MCCSKYGSTMSSVMALLVVEKDPRPQNLRPQSRLRNPGNSRCTLWDERPFILRTRSEMASFGGTDPKMGTWSLDNTRGKMSTSFSWHT